MYINQWHCPEFVAKPNCTKVIFRCRVLNGQIVYSLSNNANSNGFKKLLFEFVYDPKPMIRRSTQCYLDFLCFVIYYGYADGVFAFIYFYLATSSLVYHHFSAFMQTMMIKGSHLYIAMPASPSTPYNLSTEKLSFLYLET